MLNFPIRASVKWKEKHLARIPTVTDVSSDSDIPIPLDIG